MRSTCRRFCAEMPFNNFSHFSSARLQGASSGEYTASPITPDVQGARGTLMEAEVLGPCRYPSQLLECSGSPASFVSLFFLTGYQALDPRHGIHSIFGEGSEGFSAILSVRSRYHCRR